jgi:hypothetical protein
MAENNPIQNTKKTYAPPPRRQQDINNNLKEQKAGSNNGNNIHSTGPVSSATAFGNVPLHPKSSLIVQPKLSVNKPGDKFEQEADHIADKALKMTDVTPPGWENDISALSNEGVQTKDGSGVAVSTQLSNRIGASQGSGQKMDSTTNSYMSARIGFDFSNVKIHTGGEAAGMNRELNAKAFTTGNDIYFKEGTYNPSTSEGKQLLAHELVHTVQQTSGGGEQIQRITPPDVSGEMVGRKFSLRKDLLATDGITNVPAGTAVIITSWNNTDHFVMASATVGVPPQTVTVQIDKQYLKTVGDTGAGLKQYEMGVKNTEANIGAADKEIDAFKAKEPEYNKFNNQKGFADELARMEGLQDNRYTELNNNLIQETMVNRFDSWILNWVSYYNSLLKPATNLDANIVKSLLYEETKMGTQGEHLEMPPYTWSGLTSFPIKSRFNLGQAIDSWGPQQYIMVKEMAPAIYTKYGLSALETDNLWKSMSNDAYAQWNGGAFLNAMIEYNAAKAPNGYNLNSSSTSDLMLDYSYWIRVAVRWLFEKYLSMETPSWSGAVQAYNGSGPKAEAYRQRVMDRASKKKPGAGS